MNLKLKVALLTTASILLSSCSKTDSGVEQIELALVQTNCDLVTGAYDFWAMDSAYSNTEKGQAHRIRLEYALNSAMDSLLDIVSPEELTKFIQGDFQDKPVVPARILYGMQNFYSLITNTETYVGPWAAGNHVTIDNRYKGQIKVPCEAIKKQN